MITVDESIEDAARESQRRHVLVARARSCWLGPTALLPPRHGATHLRKWDIAQLRSDEYLIFLKVSAPLANRWIRLRPGRDRLIEGPGTLRSRVEQTVLFQPLLQQARRNCRGGLSPYVSAGSILKAFAAYGDSSIGDRPALSIKSSISSHVRHIDAVVREAVLLPQHFRE